MSPESEIRELFDRLSAGLCTCAPGIIESFDTATCLATVRVAIKLKTSEIETTPIVKYLSQPLIERVPIVLPHSIKAGLYITVPIRFSLISISCFTCSICIRIRSSSFSL